MRKFWFTIFCILLVIGALVSVAESGFGKRLVLSYATRNLKKSGIEIDAKSVSGEELRDVEVRGEGWTIRAKGLKAQIGWIRLLRSEIHVEQIILTGVELPGGKTIDVEGSVRLGRKIWIEAKSEGWAANIQGKGKEWKGDVKGHGLRGEVRGVWENGKWDGMGLVRSKDWTAKGGLQWTGSEFVINDWKIEGASIQGSGSWRIDRGGGVVGESELVIERIQDVTSAPIFGSLKAKTIWRDGECGQEVFVEMEMRELFWKELFLEAVTIQADVNDPFGQMNGSAKIDAGAGRWKGVEIHEIQVEATEETFQAKGEGLWRHPVELVMGGAWKYEKGEWSWVIENMTGNIADHPVLLIAKTELRASDEDFSVSPFQMRIGDSSVEGKWENKQGEFTLRQVPVDLFSYDVSVGGTLDLDAKLMGRDWQLSARLNESDIGSGTLNATCFQGAIEMKVEIAPLLSIHASIGPQGDLLGTVGYHGQIEKLLDYFNLGTHHFEGEVDGQLTLGGTFTEPTLDGTAIWKNGVYQNYYTGTSLRNLEAQVIAQGQEIRLMRLSGEDESGKGRISCTGNLQLLLQEYCPFRFHVLYSELRFAEIDLVAIQASGEITITGNMQEALATGDLTVEQAIITIPDRIPRSLPHLQVVYRHPIQPILPHTRKSPPYPLHLALNIDAPQHIFITGRGLNSEWRGAFAVGGTFTAPTAQGKLELLNGDFEFASRRFRLSEGALSLSGQEHEMPHLNIAASMEEGGIVITARLKGALNQPQLTFQSVPPLPISSILSRLLFGQELSEINGLQALQLANAAASLSGQTPDVLENTRRTLGVDRLRIITVPSGAEEGEDAIALQVGKYVAKGVIISVSQGAEDASSNISIEVELKHGFSFQAETEQQQEQGKFTLKWTQSY